ncbi:MAG: type IV pilus modification protein PilV [Gammaproteobacteria bacterium]
MPVKNRCKNTFKNHLQHGSTMIEVLVALLIFSFGLLGMAALQSSSIVANQSAYFRTQAISYANDMADRMRANIRGVTSSSYDDVTGTSTGSCYTASNCTPAQMAANDVFEWNAAIAAALPGGAAVVCLDSSPDDGTPALTGCSGGGDIYAVKVWWDDDRDGTAEQRVVLELSPE